MKCCVCGKQYDSFLEIIDMKVPSICINCEKEYTKPLQKAFLQNIPVTYLYDFNEQMESFLLGLKGQGNLAYIDVLIPRKTRKKLQKQFKDCILIGMPSHKDADEERGFNHVEKLFSSIGKAYYNPLEKISEKKQAHASFQERKNVKKNFRVIQEIPKDKKIVLVDDIVTSGATILAAKELLGIDSCEILTILWNHLDMANYVEFLGTNTPSQI